ncbi:MAG: hypothetical protein JXR45_21270 [Deltaproteobacteria bacterium]|nr:hypothetical protein [Deltaproteobacteria bacterium]
MKRQTLQPLFCIWALIGFIGCGEPTGIVSNPGVPSDTSSATDTCTDGSPCPSPDTDSTVDSDLLLDTETCTGAQCTLADSDTLSDSDTSIDSDIAPDSDTAPDSDIAPDSDTLPDSDTVPDSDTAADSDTAPDSDTSIDSDTALDSDTSIDSDTGSLADTDTTTDTVEPVSCTVDGDCTAGVCVASLNGNGTAIEFHCASGDGFVSGAVCGDGADCRSRICLDNRCTTPCDGADILSCPNESEQLCIAGTQISLGGVTEAFDLCVSPEDVLCQSTEACATADAVEARVCGGRRVNSNLNEVETFCVVPNTGGGAFGDACVTNDECRDNVCLRDECTVYCADASDCASYAVDTEPLVCTGTQFSPGPVTIGHCAYSCGDDADCADVGQRDKVCTMQIWDNEGVSQLDRICKPTAGTAALGTPCDSGADCESGFCVTFYGSDSCTGNADCTDPARPSCVDTGTGTSICAARLCSALCDASDDAVLNEDCDAPGNPLTTCDSTISTTLPDGTTASIEACVF